MNIEVVSFDVDGTLVDKHYGDSFWREEIPRLYADKNNIDIEEAKEIIYRDYDSIGEEDIRWYLPEFWFYRYGLEGDPKNILENLNEEVNIFDDAKEILEKLEGEYKLIVISNAARIFLEIELEEIKDYFQKIYSCTSEINILKSEQEAYIKICDDLNIETSNMLHVGDHKKFDYEIPKKLGINSILLDRDNQTKNSISGLTELLHIIDS